MRGQRRCENGVILAHLWTQNKKVQQKRNSSPFPYCFTSTKILTTIFARNYGTAAVISYNLKGIAPPIPPVQCWIDKKPDVWLRGANIETGGGREGGKNVSANGILQPNACEN